MFRPILSLIIFALSLAANADENPGDIILKKLDEIVIPIIDMEDTSLEEAIDYLRIRSIELDKDESPEFRGVSIIIRYPRTKAKADGRREYPNKAPFARIERFKTKDITLTNALIEVGKRSQTDVYITSTGIVICPKDQKPFPNPKGKNGEIFKKLTSDPAPKAK